MKKERGGRAAHLPRTGVRGFRAAMIRWQKTANEVRCW